MIRTILVGYDEERSEGSAQLADLALQRAASLASALKARLLVTRAPDPATGPPAPGRETEEVAHARRIVTEHGVDAVFVAAAGDPADALLSVAEERGVDLIVIGTHEVGVMQRLLGVEPVSDAVSRRAPCDVLIVHPRADP